MDGPETTAPAVEAGRVTQMLDTIWNKIVLGDSKLNPEKSCFELADEYRHSGKTAEECAENFIGWQTAKAGAAGFALGLPGFAAMPLTVPADFLSVAYLQLRMVAVIGILFGWDVRSDQFRTMAYLSLLGSAAGELTRDLGIKATAKIAMGTINKRISGAVLQKINRAVGTRLMTKAGSTGVVNLTKIVPVLGGLVGGGVNVLVTRQIGKTAIAWLKEGPPKDEAGAGEGLDALHQRATSSRGRLHELLRAHGHGLGGHRNTFRLMTRSTARRRATPTWRRFRRR